MTTRTMRIRALIKRLKKVDNLSKFAKKSGIPLRTLQRWVAGDNEPTGLGILALDHALAQEDRQESK